MKSLLILSILPVLAYAAVQCYVGQKLFSYEANNAICAKFIPYHCTAQCEWRRNCSDHKSFAAFKGRRTFVSGLLINSNSLMVLCCASLATRVETDAQGREKCIWRDTESISVLGPSIRTNPVLAPNHYIRDIRLEREGSARVDVALEVCQYQEEFSHCKLEDMTEPEKKRYNFIKNRLDNTATVSNVQKTGDNQKTTSVDISKTGSECAPKTSTTCAVEIQSQLNTCCKDRSTCDSSCLKSLDQWLQIESASHKKGCSNQEINDTVSCLGRLVNTQV